MSEGGIVLLAREFLRITVEVSGPLLLVSLVVGLVVSVLQVLTSVQDHTLAYIARLGAVLLVIALLGRWILHDLVAYTTQLWERMPEIVR